MMTQLLHKHCEWQEDKRPMTRHGSAKRPTMYLASMDTKTAFEVARPRHKLMGDQVVHRWITAASLREMARLEGQATLENVQSTSSFARCSGSPQTLPQHGHADLGECRARMDEEKMGELMETREGRDH